VERQFAIQRCSVRQIVLHFSNETLESEGNLLFLREELFNSRRTLNLVEYQFGRCSSKSMASILTSVHFLRRLIQV
jgi:hypothetical protein